MKRQQLYFQIINEIAVLNKITVLNVLSIK